MGKDHKFIQLFNRTIPEHFRDLAIKKSKLPNYSIAFNNYNMIYIKVGLQSEFGFYVNK